MTTYSYELFNNKLHSLLNDLQILAGDIARPSGASWQDVAGTAATHARALASLLDAAREGRGVSFIVFPSLQDCDLGAE